MIFMVDAADSRRFPEARDALLSVIGRPETRGKPLLVLASKVDLPEAKPRVVVETSLGLHEIDRNRNEWAMYEVSIKSNFNVDRALNYIVSIIMQDADVEKFISNELKRLVKNYKAMFKAYMGEAKQLERNRSWSEALDRLYKARAIQEELFKQGDGKAQKEIKKIADAIRRVEIHA
nr:ADP-ribosylation factor-like protein [Candidatus Sigynarchaeota archaeon]